MLFCGQRWILNISSWNGGLERTKSQPWWGKIPNNDPGLKVGPILMTRDVKVSKPGAMAKCQSQGKKFTLEQSKVL